MGETTYSQVVQVLGEPGGEGTSLVNDKHIKTSSYSYAKATEEPLERGVTPARVMHLSFLNGILVSQVFLSSFKSDHSNFDETKINAIVKGKTKRSEVIQLMGRPCCLYIPPMVEELNSAGIGYLYSTTMKVGSIFKNFTKSLTISFNENDEVSDINFHSSRR